MHGQLELPGLPALPLPSLRSPPPVVHRGGRRSSRLVRPLLVAPAPLKPALCDVQGARREDRAVTCGKCKLHFRPANADPGEPRCRCAQHCPCRGLCWIGCLCEAVIERREKSAAARRTRCIACLNAPEARPGVRFCRGCLEVAAAELEAIRAEEAPRVSPGGGS